jgi:hypothetical protein
MDPKTGDLAIDEPEDIGPWDALMPAQAESCQFDWKGDDSISDTNTVEIWLKAKGEVVGRGRVRLKPMYTPYLKPETIHTQQVYLSSNIGEGAVLTPKVPPPPPPCPPLIVYHINAFHHESSCFSIRSPI